MMNTQHMVAISHDDFIFLNSAAERTRQPISAVVHALIERALRDREANGRLAMQVSALVDLHALGADAVIDQAFLGPAQTPATPSTPIVDEED